MSNPPDGTVSLSRTLLCDLAKVDRSLHKRWQNEHLIEDREDGGLYGEADLIQAAALDAVWSSEVRKSSKAGVWLRLRGDIGVPKKQLHAVVDGTGLEVRITTANRQLVELVATGKYVCVIDLAGPVHAARKRLAEHLRVKATRQAGQGGEVIEADFGRQIS